MLVWALLAGMAGALALLWAFVWWEVDVVEVLVWAEWGMEWLAGVPWVVLVGAIAVLPLLGCPVSPLLVVTGIAHGMVGGILIGVAGMALSNVIGYWVAASWMHGPVERFALKRGWRIPVVPVEEVWRVVVILRLTPGIPLPVQTYLLGLARVPLMRYLLVSLLVQMLPIVAFVVTGGSLYSGSVGLVILGLCLLVVLVVGGKLALKWVAARRRARSAVADVPPV